jgi:hypothetical protein
VKWLADECFDNDIIRGLLRRSPDFDLVRAQDISEVAGRNDETLLAWAAKEDRVVLTHDLATWLQRSGCKFSVRPLRSSLCPIRFQSAK